MVSRVLFSVHDGPGISVRHPTLTLCDIIVTGGSCWSSHTVSFVNPVRPGREQRQRKRRVLGSGWQGPPSPLEPLRPALLPRPDARPCTVDLDQTKLIVAHFCVKPVTLLDLFLGSRWNCREGCVYKSGVAAADLWNRARGTVEIGRSNGTGPFSRRTDSTGSRLRRRDPILIPSARHQGDQPDPPFNWENLLICT